MRQKPTELKENDNNRKFNIPLYFFLRFILEREHVCVSGGEAEGEGDRILNRLS